MATIQYDFVPVTQPRIVLDERIQEIASERLEDADRTGFQNLGPYGSHVSGATPGDQKLNGQAGSDSLATGGGNDTMFGGSGDDSLVSFKGNDTLNGGSGGDYLWAGDDDDTLSGGSGHDDLYGGWGNDLLIGGTGDDYLNGDTGGIGDFGHDVLKGGYGDDTLEGGASGDTLTGGAGSDTFVFHRGDANLNDRDQITDFTALDVINLSMLDIGGTSDPLAAEAPYSFVGAASTQAGTVWATGKQGNWTVFVNHDGGAADMAIDVTLAGGLTSLAAADFLL